MVFGKGKQKAAPAEQNQPTMDAQAQPVTAPQAPPQYPAGAEIPQDSLKAAIEEFNSTYGGMFPAGDHSNNQALLFAIYAELRAIRLKS